jgi:hypothetical protein
MIPALEQRSYSRAEPGCAFILLNKLQQWPSQPAKGPLEGDPRQVKDDPQLA